MTARFLLDTNVVSEPIRPKPNARLLAQLKAHQHELALAAPVWHELCYGCNRLPEGKRRRAIRRYLDDVVWPSVPILPYDMIAARWHADERARLERLGLKTAFVDGQIAAVAKVNELILVSANTADYLHFDGLHVEDWRG